MKQALVWKVAVFILLLITWFLPWRFQKNDDLMMLWLVSGNYTGVPEYFAVFLHPVLSGLFSLLFSWVSGFNWYAAIWFVLNGLSFWQINTVIEKAQLDRGVKLLLRTAFLILTIHFSLSLQFTQVAGYTAFAGFLGLLATKSSKTAHLGLPLFLLTCSLLIRWEAFVLISLGLGWYYLWFDQKEVKNLLQSRKIHLLLLITALTIGSQKAHEYYSEYAEFMRFNRIRAAVIDHPVFRDEIWNYEIQPGTKLFYFSSWIFDENGFSNDELIAQKSLLDRQIFSSTHVLRTLYRTFFYLKIEKIKLLLILIFSGLYFGLVPPSKKKHAFYGLWLVLFLIANVFLVLQTRVNFFFFLILLFPVFFQINTHRKKVPPTFTLLILGLGLIHFGHFLIQEFKFQKLEKELLALMDDQGGHQLIYLEELPLERFKFLYLTNPLENLLVLGWIARSPFQEKFYRQKQLSDLKSVQSPAVVKFRGASDNLLRDYLESVSAGQVKVIKTDSTQNFTKTTYQILP